MKAEDLMIGDRVAYKNDFPDKNLQGMIGVVAGIYGRVDVRTTDGKFHESEHPGWLDPIPLTAEILEKNGFKKSIFRDIEGQHQWSWWRDTLTVVCLWMRELNDNPTDGWMIRIESTPAACCLKISSVHELQHTLKLCGIEKEIVLHE